MLSRLSTVSMSRWSVAPVRMLHATQSLSHQMSADEQRLADKLTSALQASEVHVVDISGGCGASYEVHVTSEVFKGKRMLAQHRMVTDALKDEMQDMHALRINTATP